MAKGNYLIVLLPLSFPRTLPFKQVDIFSYGIWMYELLTGCLPYLEYRSSSEIKKAIQTGVRPDFRKEGYRLSFPYAELLMNVSRVAESFHFGET